MLVGEQIHGEDGGIDREVVDGGRLAPRFDGEDLKLVDRKGVAGDWVRLDGVRVLGGHHHEPEGVGTARPHVQGVGVGERPVDDAVPCVPTLGEQEGHCAGRHDGFDDRDVGRGLGAKVQGRARVEVRHHDNHRLARGV